MYEPTNVISISYGGGEGDLPGYYLRRQCDEIMKLGLQGVTVVISSGDDGVGSYPGDAGLQNGCAGPNGTVFYPGSDATCPFVLAVGSTQLDGPPGTGNFSRTSACRLTEVATTRFPSGGGFSNVFDTPAYQRRAVETYLADTAPGLAFEGYSGDPGTNFSDVGDGVYRIGGRGYPDVAAVGDRFVVRAGGSWGTIGGTSLSAPVWAAFLTLVNEERIAAGKGTVGFINPVLVSLFFFFFINLVLLVAGANRAGSMRTRRSSTISRMGRIRTATLGASWLPRVGIRSLVWGKSFRNSEPSS